MTNAATAWPTLSRVRVSAPTAFAAIALFFGLFFIIVTPPFGSADETAHFERSYEVAIGAYTGAEGVTAGMQILMDDAFGKVVSGEAITRADRERWAATELDAQTITPWPEPLRRVMRLHSPLCYAHLAPVTAAGVALGLKPLTIFYLGRLVALFAGVALIYAAIVRAPASLRPGLIFIGLMPTTVVFLATYNIDSFLFGLGFYYFALIASLAAEPEKKATTADFAQLVVTAFLLGQFKTGYLFLPMLAILLPAGKFASTRAQITSLALIILPGAIASLGWAMIVKSQMLGDVVYSTMNGNHVEPAAQLRAILADPIGYIGTLLNTAFNSPAPALAWLSFLGLGGWTNIMLGPVLYAALTLGFLLVWLGGEKPPAALRTRFAIGLQLTIIAATVGAILTLVYLQWNGVGSPVIDGFQGRYFIAAAPLLLAAAPARLALVSIGKRRDILAFGVPVIGLVAMASAIIDHYY